MPIQQSCLDKEDFCIPLPMQIVIDDFGWWSGADDSADDGPFRTGIKRDHVPEDYIVIIELGRRLNVRPQAAMVLCEWDRENILRNVPSATWMGKNWKNPRLDIAKFEKAAEIIRQGEKHFEFTLHGLAHEFWHTDGSVSRAEWCDDSGEMRHVEDVLSHLDAYEEIMRQNSLGEFPTSFVPCASRYGFNEGEKGLLAILKSRGINYVSTPFPIVNCKDIKPQFKYFGIDQGVTIVNRGIDPVPWNEINVDPSSIRLDNQVMCGLHWPNILHQDPEKNFLAVERWIKYFKRFGKSFGRILSRNSAEHRSQLLYNELTDYYYKDGRMYFEFDKYFKYFSSHQPEGFVVNIKAAGLKQNEAGFSQIKIQPEAKQKIVTV